MEVIKYSKEKAGEWDTFVQKAKNGHFMFLRGYMDYHAHRFIDESLLFYRNNKLVALLPAHLDEKLLASHKGLTFGGIISDTAMTFSLMRDVFSVLQDHMRRRGITSLFYKAIPVCYHQIPASEDVAVLTLLGAKMVSRDLVSVVNLSAPIKYYKGVKWSIQRAIKERVDIRETSRYSDFMSIMTDTMMNKYGLEPAHSTSEIEKLADNFPDNIKLIGAFEEDRLLGGAVLYLSAQVVHAQYLGISPKGKKLSVNPYLLDSIFKTYKNSKQYFSFGTSQDGEYINENLYYFKESMGARAMLQEQYLLLC